MEWLDRTNPNNLYPFLVVLPGGGIFVSYYNEARILDAGTFATIKRMPNAPGAVNDDKGGRTYPLEGTAVLMPQKGPHYDNLGILICGGSTNGCEQRAGQLRVHLPRGRRSPLDARAHAVGARHALHSPAAGRNLPHRERCHHGVAGFGLATNPNLNALLYDPARPYGERITVMANTTIARLYHSEAITLLDGRVLISGSDPADGVHPQEYRVEVFSPPYLLGGKTRPTFALTDTDWAYARPCPSPTRLPATASCPSPSWAPSPAPTATPWAPAR